MAFSCGARSASKLKGRDYLRSTLSRRQLQGFVRCGVGETSHLLFSTWVCAGPNHCRAGQDSLFFYDFSIMSMNASHVMLFPFFLSVFPLHQMSFDFVTYQITKMFTGIIINIQFDAIVFDFHRYA